MAPSQRKLIRLALVERLQGIRTTNGYATEAGTNVRHGDAPDVGEHDRDPVVALAAGDVEIAEVTTDRKATLRWSFTAHGAIAVDLRRLLDLPGEDLLADLKRAIFRKDADGTERVTLDGLVDDIEAAPGERVIDREEAGVKTATCSLPFVVVFTEVYGQP